MRALDKSQIKLLAPAAFGTRPAPHMSEDYKLLDSESVIDVMDGLGYGVYDAGQDQPRKRHPLHVRHTVMFAPKKALKEGKGTEGTHSLIYTNSHNGRTKARFRSGYYRFVCANGLIIGDDSSVHELVHRGTVLEQIEEMLEAMVARDGERAEVIELMKSAKLKDRQVTLFGNKAKVLRFGKEKAEGYQTKDVLEVRRPEDDGNVVWNVFNRVQENLVTKSLEGKNANGRIIHSRALTNIQANQEFNAALWDLAAETARKVA